MRHVRSRPGTTMFLSSVSVFWGEVMKLVIGFFLLVGEQKGLKNALTCLYTNFFVEYKELLKTAVPSLIYSVQNMLLYHAVSHLEAATFMVTYQLKILTTAIFTVVILRRKLSVLQWISLLVLFSGVVIVQYDVKFSSSKKNIEPINITSTSSPLEVTTETLKEFITTTIATPKKEGRYQNSFLGLSFVITACVLSGFAGIYLEKMLKFSKVSLWTRNIQLATLSLPLLFAITMVRLNIYKIT